MSFGDGFKECAACAAKTGAPTLCDSCLHNRALEVERDGWRRDCIAAVKREQGFRALVANARKIARGGFRLAHRKLGGSLSAVYRALDTRGTGL